VRHATTLPACRRTAGYIIRSRDFASPEFICIQYRCHLHPGKVSHRQAVLPTRALDDRVRAFTIGGAESVTGGPVPRREICDRQRVAVGVIARPAAFFLMRCSRTYGVGPDELTSVSLELPKDSGSTRLRSLRRDDLPRFAEYRADPVLAAYQSWEPMTQAAAEAFLTAPLLNWDSPMRALIKARGTPHGPQRWPHNRRFVTQP
jgi:hypothetical protein